MKKLLSYVLILILCLTAFTGCSQPKEDEDLLSAKNYLMGMYKDKDEVTPSDYDLIGVVMVGTVKYDVEWTVDVKDGVTIVDKDTFVTIDVNEQTPTEIAYKLTATVKNEKGQTASVSFSRKVPAYKESGFADYAGAEDGANVVVKGIISGIIAKSKGNSSNCLYVQSLSGDGGYYVYGLAADPVTEGKLEVGMTVQVTGTKTTYNGTLEIENATVEIVEATNELKPVDITDIFKNAKALDDATLAGPQAMLVTIKGVEVTGQNTDSGYYKFKLGELETYVRVSSSVCPLTKDEQTAFIEGHSSHTGWIADVTGVICVYNGAFYLTPVSADAFVYLNEAEKSDADKVAAEKENLSLKSEITSNTTLDLNTAGASFDDVKIAWASDNACAVVENGKLVITLPAEATTVKVTATLTCGDAKDTREFTVNVAAAPVGNYVTTPVDTPVAGTAYKLYLTQANLGQTLYFTGEMSGNYLAAADRADMGVDVYLEAVDGGFRLYFNKDGAKQYINLYEYTAGKVGVQITAEPTAVYTWNAEAKTLVANVAGGDYYLGTYKTFSTFSASSLSYISGDKASSIGVSNFPAGFCTVAVEGGTSTPSTPDSGNTDTPGTGGNTDTPSTGGNTDTPSTGGNTDTPSTGGNTDTPSTPAGDPLPYEVGTAYNFYLIQAKLGKILYFTGEMDGNFLATSEDAGKAATVYFEAVDGGYRIYFTKDGAKQYINIYEYTEGKVGVQITAEPTAVFTYNAASAVMVANVADTDYYLGTYYYAKNDVNYTTMSASKTTYITGDNAANVGVTQFPATFCVPGTKIEAPAVQEPETSAPAPEVTVPEAVDPVAGTAYKLTVNHVTNGTVNYFTGEIVNKYYYGTSTTASEGVNVYIEEATGGFYLCFTKDGTKQYVVVSPRDGDATKANISFSDTASTVFVYNSEWKTLVTTIGEQSFYLGSYGTHDTISISNISYISGDSASNLGTTNFVTYFVPAA